ncbi:hypothetical protein ONV78_30915 [Hahella sp. CR1]|uniref:hypothetical protein n=1 Tax=Hahella sp. CR1 TaxID=2992807 RepID=UPI0024415A25|nr:hypothetical protein [Hahella sp. CR1]MDG9672183.1 hypothetical protein [Hahella sp. CR1]
MNHAAKGIALLLMLALSNANSAISPESSTSTAITQAQSSVNKSEPEKESFSEFYNAFSTAIDKNDWRSLADLTHFPFIFQGQLDMEGKISIEKDEFVKLMPLFLEKETFINIDGDMFPTTYRVIAVTPLEESTRVYGEEADIHDFHFSIVNGHWRLVRVVTDLSNVKHVNYKII